MEFFPSIDVNATQAEAIARGLYAVAAVDGVHERELALISEFCRTTVSGEGGEGSGLGTSTLASLARVAPLEPDSLAPLLPGEPLRQLFVKAAYLVAWADGRRSRCRPRGSPPSRRR